MTPLKEGHKQGTLMAKRTASSDSGMPESSDSWTSAVVAHYDGHQAGMGSKNGSSAGVDSVPSDEQSAVEEKKIDVNDNDDDEDSAANSWTHRDEGRRDDKEVKSAFRQSLMATHSRDSPRAAPVVASDMTSNENDSSSKSLLRQSMSATILTHTERTFLESLLALEGDLADLLCGEAHRKLSANDGAFDTRQHDKALGVFGLCDAGEMCLGTRVPGHGWQAVATGEEAANVADSQDWVQTWVRRGSSADSREVVDRGQGPVNGRPSQQRQQPPQQQTCPAASSLSRQQSSSTTRLDRLAYKKRQSSTGNDSTVRLYRAHEAGLVVSQQGSARRSLARLGLEIDPRNTQGLASGGSQFGAGGAGASQAHKAFFQDEESTPVCTGSRSRKSIDDVVVAGNKREEERTIRAMEVNERSKQKRRQHALAELDVLASRTNYSPGCISPFSVGILKNMYASKQFSFRRSNSSYSRYDSFLNERGEIDADNDIAVQESKTESTATMNSSTSSTSSVVQAQRAAARDDIFRPSPTERRLNSLLVSAGFSTPKGMLMEAEEDMLSLDNSLGKLLLKGGPSFREETVFRGEQNDETAPVIVEVKAKKKKPVESSLVSSLGSNFSHDEGEEVENNQENKALNGPDSPTNSEVGELPPRSTKNSLHKRNSTVSIMKSSSSSSLKKSQYRRSVSWGHIVVKDSETSSPSKQSESEATGISVISFPNLRRAAPIRSDSIGSAASGAVSIPPLRLGAPLRSESMSSVASILSFGAPPLARAHPIYSPQSSLVLERLPSLHRATRLRSESINTVGTEIDDDYSVHSFNESDNQKQKLRTFSNGAAWASPFAPKRWQPPRQPLSRQSSTTSLTGRNILIRQASKNNYEGEGMEVDEFVDGSMSLGSARNFKSMLSIGGDSVVSTRSRSSFSRVAIPIQSLDDGFIVRNLDFERHSSEILRSLSNEDLYTSHNVETLGGSSSVTRVYGDLMEGDSKSWDMQDEPSYAPPQNAWNVFKDEYAEEYGAYNSLSFQILGTTAGDTSCHPHVLSPPLIESLQNFLPSGVAENNFWLKYSLVRDGASLPSLLRQVRGAQHTLIAIETVDGEVFGCFTSSPWRKTWNYYGSGEAFLWRMRRTRSDKDVQRSILDQAKLESELDVFYWTGRNDLVQLCTHDMIAVGGGTFHSTDAERRSSLSDEERDLPPAQSEVFTKADKGGFGLAIDAELLRGTSSPCATFNSPPLSKAHANGSPFEIINLEVWTLTPCNNVADAETLEMKKLFLEPYAGAQ